MTVMDEHEVAWPTGMSDQDPAARGRPLVFNPQGFLVAILQDADQAEQARASLADAGFADRDLRVYTSQQILDSWERFQAERSRLPAGGVSTWAYYAWSASGDSGPSQAERKQVELVAEIRTIHRESGGAYGSLRVTAEVRHRGWRVNHSGWNGGRRSPLLLPGRHRPVRHPDGHGRLRLSSVHDRQRPNPWHWGPRLSIPPQLKPTRAMRVTT
jgi:helix-turn-helix protein